MKTVGAPGRSSAGWEGICLLHWTGNDLRQVTSHYAPVSLGGTPQGDTILHRAICLACLNRGFRISRWRPRWAAPSTCPPVSLEGADSGDQRSRPVKWCKSKCVILADGRLKRQ